jgi:hypothetical protein
MTNDRDVFGERVMNNFSLLAANRLTHLKVVMLAFSFVTLVVGFGLVHSALSQEPTSISTIVARVTGAIIHAL